MEFYKYAETFETGNLIFPASVWLNLLTETEMCAFFRSSTQIIADTALLMTNRDWVVNVESTNCQFSPSSVVIDIQASSE